MAVVIANVRRTRSGNLREVIVDITGPNPYTVNGEIFTLAQLQALAPEIYSGQAALPGNLNAFVQFDAECSNLGWQLFLDRANLKIKYFNGIVEATAISLAAVTCRCRITYQAVTG